VTRLPAPPSVADGASLDDAVARVATHPAVLVFEELAGRSLATTWAPVPRWRTRSAALEPDEVHPWPWLVRPGSTSVRSFSAWPKDSPRVARTG
jgi:hypothetical protein